MTDENVEQISVETIENPGQNGEVYRYFRVKNSEFQGIVFTITEIKTVKVSELMDEVEEGIDPEETTMTGRVLFEETMNYTSGQLLQDERFATIVRDVFDKIIQDILTIQQQLEAEQTGE